MMIDSHPAEYQLERWVLESDRLPPVEQNEIKSHLRSCSICRDHVEQLEKSFKTLQEELKKPPSHSDLELSSRLMRSELSPILPFQTIEWRERGPGIKYYGRLLAPSSIRLFSGRLSALVRQHPVQFATSAVGILLIVLFFSLLRSLPAKLTLTSVEPTVLTGNIAYDTLIIRGSGFGNDSRVLISIIDPPERSFVRKPTLVDENEMILILRVGTDPSIWSIQVINPDSLVSDTAQFHVVAPVPETPWLIPKSATAGGPGVTLTISGTTFTSFSVVRWNGQDRVTTPIVNRGGLVTGLIAAISSSDIAVPGKVEVTVYNPGPGGGLSKPAHFMIEGRSL